MSTITVRTWFGPILVLALMAGCEQTQRPKLGRRDG
jgi:hypothetical protein